MKRAEELELALMEIEENKLKYSEMRRFVKNLVFTYSDTKSTYRIFERFLSKVS